VVLVSEALESVLGSGLALVLELVPVLEEVLGTVQV